MRSSFALYDFLESHAASFALLAYASAYFKVKYLTAFTCALLNNRPATMLHMRRTAIPHNRPGSEQGVTSRKAPPQDSRFLTTASRLRARCTVVRSRELRFPGRQPN